MKPMQKLDDLFTGGLQY